MTYSPAAYNSSNEDGMDERYSPFPVEEDGMDEYSPPPLYAHSGSPSARPDPPQFGFPFGYSDVQVDRYQFESSPNALSQHWRAPSHRSIELWGLNSLPEGFANHATPSNPATLSPLSPGPALGEIRLPPLGGGRRNGGNGAKKFKCPMLGCGQAFARKADKERHYECVHKRDVNRKYNCEVENCTRVGDQGFTRKDHLREHKRNFHHQDIPKRGKVQKKKKKSSEK